MPLAAPDGQSPKSVPIFHGCVVHPFQSQRPCLERHRSSPESHTARCQFLRSPQPPNHQKHWRWGRWWAKACCSAAKLAGLENKQLQSLCHPFVLPYMIAMYDRKRTTNFHHLQHETEGETHGYMLNYCWEIGSEWSTFGCAGHGC